MGAFDGVWQHRCEPYLALGAAVVQSTEYLAWGVSEQFRSYDFWLGRVSDEPFWTQEEARALADAQVALRP